MGKCKATRVDGEPCRAPALRGSDRCWWHSAAARADMVDACRRGGQNRRKPVLLPEAEPLTPDRTRAILASVLEALLSGALDGQTARSVGYIVGVDGKLFETVQLESRIAALEDLKRMSRES